jgi:hypothetical protein
LFLNLNKIRKPGHQIMRVLWKNRKNNGGPDYGFI